MSKLYCCVVGSTTTLKDRKGNKIHIEDVNDPDKSGNTFLHVAARYNHFECAKNIILRGGNVNAKNMSGKTPLHLASEKYSFESMKVLIENGANPNEKDNDGNTPLHLIDCCRLEPDETNNLATECIKLLVENGARVNEKDCYGNTPLHLACVRSSLDDVLYFVRFCDNINEKNNKGDTPLHTVCKHINVMVAYEATEIIKFLIKNGADITDRNDKNRTPLSFLPSNHFILEMEDYSQKNGIFDIKQPDC